MNNGVFTAQPDAQPEAIMTEAAQPAAQPEAIMTEAAQPAAHPELPVPRTKRELEDLCKALESAQEQMLSLPKKSPERKALKAHIRQLDLQCSAGAKAMRERNLTNSSLRKEWAHTLFASYSDHTNHIRFIGFVAVMAHMDALTGGGMGATVTKDHLVAMFKDDFGVQGDHMSEGQFEAWMKMFLGTYTEKKFVGTVQKLIQTNELMVGEGLFKSADRLEIVNMLFDSVDLDNSGSLSLDEFTQLLQSLDELITEEDVKASFKETGVADGEPLRKHHFYRWVNSTFGHLEDDVFFEELDDLMEELREFKIPLTEHRRELAEQLFLTYDLDCSSFIDLAEFVALMQKLDPTMTGEDIKGSMEAAGAVDDGLNLSQFYYWIHHMFSDFEEEDYDDCMSELMNFATEMRMAELATRGQANSRPDKISYGDTNTGQDVCTTDFSSITELNCRETARFSTGAIILTPSDAVGVDLKFEVDPRLPLGLSLGPTGTISGTPELGTSGKQTYTVTAQNKQGSATCTFTIIIKSQGRRLRQFGTVAAKLQRQATGFGNHRAGGQTVKRNIREQINTLCTTDIVGDGENKESVNAMLQKLEAEKSELNKRIEAICVMKDREQRAAEHASGSEEYLSLLHTADTADFSSLKDSEYLHIVVDPALERPLVIWVAKKINVETLDMDLIMMHLCYSLDKVTRKPFTCVLDLSDAESDNVTSMPWLNKVRTIVPQKHQSNAMELVIIGATVTTKIKVSTFKPLVTAPMWDSFSYLDGFDGLCSHFQVSPDFWPDCMNPKKLEENTVSEKVAAALASASGQVANIEGTGGDVCDQDNSTTAQVESGDSKSEDSSFFGSNPFGGFPKMDESMNLFSGNSVFGAKSSSQIPVLQEQIQTQEFDLSQNVDRSPEQSNNQSEALDDLRISLIQLQIETLTSAMAGVQDSHTKLCVQQIIDALENKFTMITQARQNQVDNISEDQPLEGSTKHLSLLSVAISACKEIFENGTWNNDVFAEMDRISFARMQQTFEQEAHSLEESCATLESVVTNIQANEEVDAGSSLIPEDEYNEESSLIPEDEHNAESSLVPGNELEAEHSPTVGDAVSVDVSDAVIFGVASPRSQTPLPEALVNSNEEQLLSYREAQKAELEMLTKELEEDPLIKKQLRAQQLANQMNQLDQVLSIKTVNRKNEGDTIELPGLDEGEPNPEQVSARRSKLGDGPEATQQSNESEPDASFFSKFSPFGSSNGKAQEENSDAKSKEESSSFFSFGGSSNTTKEDSTEPEQEPEPEAETKSEEKGSFFGSFKKIGSKGSFFGN